MFERVFRKNALGGGKVNGKVGFHYIAKQACQCVVIAEFKFVNDDRIVFVDNGHDIPLQKLLERVFCVEKAFPAA